LLIGEVIMMNLRHLNIFKTVAEVGSMSRAGKILYMSQPAVSQTIIELEDHLNSKLFERSSRKLFLTYSGQIFYDYTLKILTLVDEAQNSLKDISNARKGKIILGASTTIGIYLVPKIIAEFMKQYPSIEIKYIIDNTRVIEQMILEHEIDVGLVEGSNYSKETVLKHFLDDELYLICSSDHRWVKNGHSIIEPQEISSQMLILREKGSGTREVIEKVMSKHHLSYHTTHILNNTEAIKSAVEANFGVAFLSRMSIQKEIKSKKLFAFKVENMNLTTAFRIRYIFNRDNSPNLQTVWIHPQLNL
jgi:DNA-binding transcriptional LysR family regulator